MEPEGSRTGPPQSKQLTRQYSPTHQQKIGLKIHWAWPCPPEQDPVSPQPVPPKRKLTQASYSHNQKAYRSSKNHSLQNENYNHRKLIKLITWITALSNSMKLWAMSCRAILLTKCGPLKKGMTNYFGILALRTPWTLRKWKKKKWHWKMNSPGW